MFSFLKCLNYTPNCYDCRYAGTARGADLTLGDSWGSELPKVERDKGVSLILCVSSKGRELLDATQLRLEEVDVRRAVEFNKQLREPAKNEKREKFFALIEKGKSYDCAVARCYPKIFMKQWVKKILLRLKVLKKRSEGATYNLYIRCDERATF